MGTPSETERLRKKRAELEAKLQKLAEKVVGAGHPDAPRVVVDVREPVDMTELPGAKPISRRLRHGGAHPCE